MGKNTRGEKTRRKLSAEAKRQLAPQPEKVMVLKNGRKRMVLAEELKKP